MFNVYNFYQSLPYQIQENQNWTTFLIHDLFAQGLLLFSKNDIKII